MTLGSRLAAPVLLALAIVAAAAGCGRDVTLGVDPVNADASPAGDAAVADAGAGGDGLDHKHGPLPRPPRSRAF